MEEYRMLCRWEENNKMDLKQIDADMMDSIEIVQDIDHWRVLINALLVTMEMGKQC